MRWRTLLQYLLIITLIGMLSACDQAGPSGLINDQPSHDVFGVGDATSQAAQSYSEDLEQGAANSDAED